MAVQAITFATPTHLKLTKPFGGLSTPISRGMCSFWIQNPTVQLPGNYYYGLTRWGWPGTVFAVQSEKNVPAIGYPEGTPESQGPGWHGLSCVVTGIFPDSNEVYSGVHLLLQGSAGWASSIRASAHYDFQPNIKYHVAAAWNTMQVSSPFDSSLKPVRIWVWGVEQEVICNSYPLNEGTNGGLWGGQYYKPDAAGGDGDYYDVDVTPFSINYSDCYGHIGAAQGAARAYTGDIAELYINVGEFGFKPWLADIANLDKFINIDTLTARDLGVLGSEPLGLDWPPQVYLSGDVRTFMNNRPDYTQMGIVLQQTPPAKLLTVVGKAATAASDPFPAAAGV